MRCADEARTNGISTAEIGAWDASCDAALEEIGSGMVAQHTTATTVYEGKASVLHRVSIAQPCILTAVLAAQAEPESNHA